jgi:hypothetical protein
MSWTAYDFKQRVSLPTRSQSPISIIRPIAMYSRSRMVRDPSNGEGREEDEREVDTDVLKEVVVLLERR